MYKCVAIQKIQVFYSTCVCVCLNLQCDFFISPIFSFSVVVEQSVLSVMTQKYG